MATANSLAIDPKSQAMIGQDIAFDYSGTGFKTYANEAEWVADIQKQEAIDKIERDRDKIKRLQQVGKDLLGRAPGQEFYDYFGGQYETLVSEGMSPDDAIGVISKHVSGTSESQAFKEDERVAAQYEGAPGWFTPTPGGGNLPGHSPEGKWVGGHEGDFQATLDPSFLQVSHPHLMTLSLIHI